MTQYEVTVKDIGREFAIMELKNGFNYDDHMLYRNKEYIITYDFSDVPDYEVLFMYYCLKAANNCTTTVDKMDLYEKIYGKAKYLESKK